MKIEPKETVKPNKKKKNYTNLTVKICRLTNRYLHLIVFVGRFKSSFLDKYMK